MSENKNNQEKIIVNESDFGKRLDVFLQKKFPEYSRTYLQKRIKEEDILINNEKTNSGYKLREGDILKVFLKETKGLTKIIPQDIPLNILYEDEEIVLVNKSSNMVVHPACGNFEGTLVNALAYHFHNLPISQDKRDVTSWIRPGLVHRLDKNTSGIMIIAKTDQALKFLAKQFDQRKVIKKYRAIVVGDLRSDKGTIDAPLARHPSNRKLMTINASSRSRSAVTDYEVLGRFLDRFMLMEMTPKTGRTHQVRVHLKYIGCRILQDKEYGIVLKEFNDIAQRSLLHAYSLEFTHPTTKKRLKFTAPIPEDFKKVLKRLKS